MTTHSTLTGNFVNAVLNSKLPAFILVITIIAGLFSLYATPREEEPQIVVPMIDVKVQVPGVNAKQVARQVTTPLEKLLAQVKGIEHVYSVSDNEQAIVTLRFHVGENRENALLNTYNKLHSNLDKVPDIVSHWQVEPVEVDDVAIVMLGLWSSNTEQVDDYQLRRLAEEISTHLQAIKDTSEINVIGGRKREVQIQLLPEKMAARNVTMSDIVSAIQVSNVRQTHGNIILNQQSIAIESGDVYQDIAELEQAPISVINGSVVLLKDIAQIIDGPSEPKNYAWLDFAEQSTENQPIKQSDHPMVTISVAKQPGSNAVSVAKEVHQVMNHLAQTIFPQHAHMQVLRDYGQTANEKVNNLTTSLAFAVFTVIIFIGVFLGWRSALVVGLAVPICYGITLTLDYAFGYTINRVTLFALILSLGLLVDDPITGVDNIERKLKSGDSSLNNAIVSAISEIRIPLLMSTLTIVLAFLPLAFITGMMGPYMAPMAFNVPLSVISSTLVAFLVTPWLAKKFIRPISSVNLQNHQEQENSSFQGFYRKLLTPLLEDKSKAKKALFLVLLLFITAAILPVLRIVPLKLLPFDNKNEVQIIIDMPESTNLEQTAAMAKQVSNLALTLAEVDAVASFVGLASPMDFNGMVRQYYLRNNTFQADLRLVLNDKTQREHQSHAIVLRLRELLSPLSRSNAQGRISIKVIEVPPGPPVLSTLVAEVYGNEFSQYEQLQKAAKVVMKRFAQEPHVVEIDSSVADDQQLVRYITDKTKAALSGVDTQSINQALNIANQGQIISFLHHDNEATPLAIKLMLAQAQHENLSDLNRIAVKGRKGIVQNSTAQCVEMAPQPLVPLGELGEFTRLKRDKAIFHKDLKPVVYVTADISGRTPAEVIADISSDLNNDAMAQETPRDYQARSFLNSGGGLYWQLPDNIKLSFSGEGEWRITIRVFRDMGLAFAFALAAIYLVLRIQTQSAALSGIIMSAIPLTVIGIMPGFYMLNQFGEREIAGAPEPVLFTATAMIGMIALAGIVVRNSLILIEFISQAQQQGATVKESLIQAGAVRMRPVLLTAGTTLLGNLVITLDPVFSGLAIAIIFGIISSTIFTLLVVPIVYALVFDKSMQSSVNKSNAKG